MFALLLFDAGYLFGGIADFFLWALLLVGGLGLLMKWLESRRESAKQNVLVDIGCTAVLLLAGLLLAVYLFFAWLAG